MDHFGRCLTVSENDTSGQSSEDGFTDKSGVCATSVQPCECGHVVGVPVQKASQCAREVRHYEGGRQEEVEQRHVSLVGDAEGRGEYCIHAQAELHVNASSSSLSSSACLPPSAIPSLLSFI